MIVKVIKEFKKHTTIRKVGDEFGVTKDLARILINQGLVIDLYDVLKLTKKEARKADVKPKKKSNGNKTNKKA